LETVAGAENGRASSKGFSLASWDIVAAVVVEERGGDGEMLIRVICDQRNFKQSICASSCASPVPGLGSSLANYRMQKKKKKLP
jgi:hypothetical protein